MYYRITLVNQQKNQRILIAKVYDQKIAMEIYHDQIAKSREAFYMMEREAFKAQSTVEVIPLELTKKWYRKAEEEAKKMWFIEEILGADK